MFFEGHVDGFRIVNTKTGKIYYEHRYDEAETLFSKMKVNFPDVVWEFLAVLES